MNYMKSDAGTEQLKSGNMVERKGKQLLVWAGVGVCVSMQ